ncbi:chemotaxis protein CheD [Sporolactobacillus sp. THM7-7]|nr:chemotaxis protein CheD [Sporolactobacillus sp. THM7-7]
MIHVGLSEVKFASLPESLGITGLGSCVGVVLYNEARHIAGMAHVMLPDSALARSDRFSPGKFADTAVLKLVSVLTGKHGVSRAALKAKLAGGAEMFRTNRSSPLGHIGRRNITAVKQELDKLGIPIISEETGADYGRTIEFFTSSCTLRIRTVCKGEITL